MQEIAVMVQRLQIEKSHIAVLLDLKLGESEGILLKRGHCKQPLFDFLFWKKKYVKQNQMLTISAIFFSRNLIYESQFPFTVLKQSR